MYKVHILEKDSIDEMQRRAADLEACLNMMPPSGIANGKSGKPAGFRVSIGTNLCRADVMIIGINDAEDLAKTVARAVKKYRRMVIFVWFYSQINELKQELREEPQVKALLARNIDNETLKNLIMHHLLGRG